MFFVLKRSVPKTVLLSTHTICFGWEIRKLIFWYTLLTKGLKLIKKKCQQDSGWVGHFLFLIKGKKDWHLYFN